VSAAWRALASAAAPALGLWLRRRVRLGKEDPARLGERRGIASRPRPAGPLVWIHAASVGESRSALPLLARVLDAHPRAHALMTSGTLTSARLLADALPPRALHQFAPLDVPAWIEGFLDHWRPDAALWLESELWPNTLAALAARGVPAALVNARMSESSFARWRRAGAVLRPPLDAFALVLAQTEEIAARFRMLGARDARHVGNLKYDVDRLSADPAALAEAGAALAGRPAWLAASTHPGEEEIVADAHRRLAPRVPGLLTILVPRHATRGDAIAAALRAGGVAVAQRSRGEAPRADTAFWLADTMGELGLFYRLAPVVFVGGSLVPHGGQNPLEPAALEAALLLGPHTFNFADIVGALTRAGAAREVIDAESLAEAVAALLVDAAARRRMGQAGVEVWAAGRGAVERVRAALAPVLAPLDRAPG
jgi:3-deoxy-D-manno-octulosonic-acid transferase